MVRHALAGRRSTWKGDDLLRPLSTRGATQAQALVPILSGYRPYRILTSPYRRCVQTVEPTAEALGLEVEPIELLAEGHGPEVIDLMPDLAGGTLVLCTHGDVATAVLDAFGHGGRVDVGPHPTLEKGAVWVLRRSKGQLVVAEHLRPLVKPAK